jgi:putative nucleotidyltransferase-like protein
VSPRSSAATDRSDRPGVASPVKASQSERAAPEIPSDMAPTTGASPGSEWDLLLTLISASPEKVDDLSGRVQRNADWPKLLRLADHHGVSSLLYQSLLRMGDSTAPAEVMQSLRRRHDINVHKCLFLTRELVRILDNLDSLGIEVMPYKGAVQSQILYGDMALRQSGDMDLLVHGSDLPRIKNGVSELGYTPHLTLSEAAERAYVRSGYECTFDHAGGRNLLETQWALQPSFYSVDFDMSGLFSRAVTVSVAGRQVKTPSPEDLLLILSLHGAKHVWGRLIWLCDIAQITKQPDLNWDLIISQAKALGIERIMHITLLLAKGLLEAEIPPSLNNTLLNDSASCTLADGIRIEIANGVSRSVESLAYFKLMIRVRERRGDRLRFLRRLTFTPGTGEWEAIQLPTRLFPLYRVVRLWRLGARLFRGRSGTISVPKL